MKSLILQLYQIVFYWEATLLRNRYHGPMIAITGSVGKTSTKEAIGLVVKTTYGDGCLITPKSFNTELGVPLALLGFKSEPKGIGWLVALVKGLYIGLFGRLPKCVVLELGADKKGDIAYLARLVRPTYAVITNISESHSQFLGSLEAIRREKLSLFEFLSLDGKAYISGDDSNLRGLRFRPTQKITTVRLHTRADYFASGIKIDLHGTTAIIHHNNRTQKITIKRYGEHHIYAVLFAAAIADSLGISSQNQIQAFKQIVPLPGRGTLIEAKNGALILDESYNAQPAAMVAALELLGQMPAKKRVAILGDMRELKEPDVIHKEMGKLARRYADHVIAVGPLSRSYRADEWFMTAQEAIPAALRQLEPGVIVLVKGSQNTIRLERVVKAIMRNPNQAKQLLVRQEDDWLRKN